MVPVQREKGIVVMQFDALDKKLLNMIQSNFPLVPEPYRELGNALGITEEEVIARLQSLMESGVIRRLGGVFDSRKLGYSGTLCAMNVPDERIRAVAGVVNSFDEVTHNYLREDYFNMWFTVLAPTVSRLGEILDEIRELTGIQEILTLPSENVFKIRVNFDLD
ncbi:MAG TPA: AsnC family transcriptional regulator [Bacillota bacterium]|jgi:DNA-binding Lrp family transcriptional regulator|nr:AsnC family transcriptional regulator [Peptococcaceae bacterium MAG4]HPZ42621.1 AsnC family transcriptional regulator [Bacillota bacterium]HQD75624.1 AsnC family transcriptional regulator [Bacillota bacterium]HUM59468.1 AsnC family transcriptional regulator [Bacillota bacterium]